MRSAECGRARCVTYPELAGDPFGLKPYGGMLPISLYTTLMEDTNSQTTWSTRLLRFFSHPLVGVIGSLASVVSIPLAFYFYFHGSGEPELVYYVNPARAAVVNQGAASRLTVSFDGHPLSADVTATQVAIWNRSRLSIRPSAVLEPLVIR